MKRMKCLALVLTAMLLLSMMVGCSAGYEGGDYADVPASGVAGNGIYENGSDSELPALESDRKLIRTVTIRAETADQDTLLADLDAKVAELGGYVQNKTVNNNKSSNRSATLKLRIPADKLDAFVDHVEGQTNILSSNETAEDITLNYIAIASRITALETEETRLLELIEKAENLSALLQLESKLTEVRTKLEEYKSQLKVYDNLVDYATVNLTITEVKEYTVVEEEPSTWERITTGFADSVKGAWTIVREIFVFFIVALPYLVLLAIVPAIVLVVVLVIIKIVSKRRKQPKS